MVGRGTCGDPGGAGQRLNCMTTPSARPWHEEGGGIPTEAVTVTTATDPGFVCPRSLQRIQQLRRPKGAFAG